MIHPHTKRRLTTAHEVHLNASSIEVSADDVLEACNHLIEGDQANQVSRRLEEAALSVLRGRQPPGRWPPAPRTFFLSRQGLSHLVGLVALPEPQPEVKPEPEVQVSPQLDSGPEQEPHV